MDFAKLLHRETLLKDPFLEWIKGCQQTYRSQARTLAEKHAGDYAAIEPGRVVAVCYDPEALATVFPWRGKGVMRFYIPRVHGLEDTVGRILVEQAPPRALNPDFERRDGTIPKLLRRFNPTYAPIVVALDKRLIEEKLTLDQKHPEPKSYDCDPNYCEGCDKCEAMDAHNKFYDARISPVLHAFDSIAKRIGVYWLEPTIKVGDLLLGIPKSKKVWKKGQH